MVPGTAAAALGASAAPAATTAATDNQREIVPALMDKAPPGEAAARMPARSATIKWGNGHRQRTGVLDRASPYILPAMPFAVRLRWALSHRRLPLALALLVTLIAL